MKDVMPIGGNEWDGVLDCHSFRFPGREVDSLPRKFSQLHRKSTPAGDPMCPTEAKLLIILANGALETDLTALRQLKN
jgi:hypothetical protein